MAKNKAPSRARKKPGQPGSRLKKATSSKLPTSSKLSTSSKLAKGRGLKAKLPLEPKRKKPEGPKRTYEEKLDIYREAPMPPPAPESARALVPLDPLERYMAEVKSYPLLTPEEEKRLAIRVKENRDPQAARALVLANLRLVVKISLEYHRAWSNLLDLIQEGNLGLLLAVKNFDPYREVKLSSYAQYWVRAYILKFIMHNLRLIKIGTTHDQKKLFYRLSKEKEKLEKLGYRATPKLLAERLDVEHEDVIDMQTRLAEPEVSIDSAVSEGSKTTLGEMLGADEKSAEEAVTEAQLREVIGKKVKEFSGTLSENERRILYERILSDEPSTLQELGDAFGVTRERVRQIEEGIIKKLHGYLKEHFKDYALLRQRERGESR